MPFYKKTPIEAVKTALESGKSYVEIGEELKLSKQRIQQIAKKLGINSVKQKQALRKEKYQQKWGKRENTDFYKACREKFRRKKANALATGYEWTVNFGELEWPTHCPILDIELDYFSEYRAENSPSFDRLDSSRGYVTGNVVVVSWRANRIKNDGTLEEHRKIMEYLENITQK